MDKYYAGIGSRSTPSVILDLMTRLAYALAADGWTLRSGHAGGADQAFAIGAQARAQIFLPWTGFNSDVAVVADEAWGMPQPWTTAFAAKAHPAWDRCSRGTRLLHSRNVHQVLGPVRPGAEGFQPVTFVICWAPTDKAGQPTGGTAQACRIAADWDIPVLNLAVSSVLDAVEARLEDLTATCA